VSYDSDMRIEYAATLVLSLVGSFGFGCAMGCHYETAFWWAIGWTCASLSAHRIFRAMKDNLKGN
jgi:hypothetical protein